MLKSLWLIELLQAVSASWPLHVYIFYGHLLYCRQRFNRRSRNSIQEVTLALKSRIILVASEVGVLLCICDGGTNFLPSESKLQRQIDRNRTGVASSHIIDLVWPYRLTIAVVREGVFYLPMLITTCLPGREEGEGVDSSLCPNLQTQFSRIQAQNARFQSLKTSVLGLFSRKLGL